MTGRAVVDASATLAWLFGEKREGPLRHLTLDGARFVSPWLWRIEVVNALLVKERQRILTKNQTAAFLQILDTLEIEVIGEPANRTMAQLALFARPWQLTAYDAVYLELASALNIPLCTLDKNLRHAAAQLGVEVLDTDY